ncbi:Asp-tRNA(Asn)/Glu-tRNA(Gln) amidotransferase subunit GatC [Candidiatus Paracoxiella cheracis]|uniref:Asp-tRNA(Asn)/Glu-tRNA(Gln) amidotransferase subunit GatC n=1 Tax=Candidiatus Paracoxiella cheracis TaxID=3405120 RepID=UPI003BF4C877
MPKDVYNDDPFERGSSMTTLKTDDINHIAHLARLTIPKEENELLLNELNKILDMVAEMNAVSTDKVDPLAHPYDEKQPLRADVVTETDQRQLFQKIAPQTQAGLYIVPAVIENNE